jgi:hypothetical protein
MDLLGRKPIYRRPHCLSITDTLRILQPNATDFDTLPSRRRSPDSEASRSANEGSHKLAHQQSVTRQRGLRRRGMKRGARRTPTSKHKEGPLNQSPRLQRKSNGEPSNRVPVRIKKCVVSGVRYTGRL